MYQRIIFSLEPSTAHSVRMLKLTLAKTLRALNPTVTEIPKAPFERDVALSVSIYPKKRLSRDELLEALKYSKLYQKYPFLKGFEEVDFCPSKTWTLSISDSSRNIMDDQELQIKLKNSLKTLRPKTLTITTQRPL